MNYSISSQIATKIAKTKAVIKLKPIANTNTPAIVLTSKPININIIIRETRYINSGSSPYFDINLHI